MFSVVIPLYNKEISIKSTIQSVLDQTFLNFEVIVVNDGSTDNSVKEVKEIKDDRIRIFNKTNGGVSSARNFGIEKAKYDWIAFLDGDDLWFNNHLEEILKMMNVFPKEVVFVTSFKYSDNRVIKKSSLEKDIYLVDDYFRKAIIEPLICTDVVVIKKECFLEVGGFNEKLKYGEDLDLWTRLARNFKIVKSNKVTSVYRINAENRSSLSYDLRKSRVFYYNFKDSISASEVVYHKIQIIGVLRSFLVRGKLKNFFVLWMKHYRTITFFDIIKKNSL